MQSVYVAGVGMTKFGKDPRPLAEIFCQAAKLSVGAAELDKIDALYIGVLNPEEFTGDSNIASLIADAIGLTGIPALRIETASSAGAAPGSGSMPGGRSSVRPTAKGSLRCGCTGTVSKG